MACQGAVARYPPAGGRPRLIPGRGMPQHAPNCGDKHFGEETAPRRQTTINDSIASITSILAEPTDLVWSRCRSGTTRLAGPVGPPALARAPTSGGASP